MKKIKVLLLKLLEENMLLKAQLKRTYKLMEACHDKNCVYKHQHILGHCCETNNKLFKKNEVRLFKQFETFIEQLGNECDKLGQ